MVGTQLNAEDLAKRRNYKYVNRVTLKSNLAAAMLRKAGLLEPRPGARLLDMFCGSGTVPVNAAGLVGHVRSSTANGTGSVRPKVGRTSYKEVTGS